MFAVEIDEALKYDVIAMPKDAEMNGYAMKTMQDHLGEDTLTLIALPETEVDVENDAPNCVLCEFIMTKIEMELRKKTEQEKIKEMVENICNVMPKTVAQSCNKFMEKYMARIINLLSVMPPKQVCTEMQLCARNHREIGIPKGVVVSFAKTGANFNHHSALLPINRDVTECGVCHGATKALLPYFRQYHLNQFRAVAGEEEDQDVNYTNEMIAVACEHLPAKYYETVSLVWFILWWGGGSSCVK